MQGRNYVSLVNLTHCFCRRLHLAHFAADGGPAVRARCISVRLRPANYVWKWRQAREASIVLRVCRVAGVKIYRHVWHWTDVVALSSLVSVAVSPFGQRRGEPKPIHRCRPCAMGNGR